MIYSAITSRDGYVEDTDGTFNWAAPDDEVHAFINDLARPVGTYLYGRPMYETMLYWETAHTFPIDVTAPRMSLRHGRTNGGSPAAWSTSVTASTSEKSARSVLWPECSKSSATRYLTRCFIDGGVGSLQIHSHSS